MLNYDQIKAKYADDVAKRNSEIILARSRVERLEAQLTFFSEEQEKYRNNGTFDAHKVRMFNSYDTKLRELREKLKEAKNKLKNAELGEYGMQVIDKAVENMKL